jgi:hypothetical protein
MLGSLACWDARKAEKERNKLNAIREIMPERKSKHRRGKGRTTKKNANTT